MSRFVQQSEIADPFVLEVIDRPEPHAAPGQVRVRVRAAGLNPVDWKIASHPEVAAHFGVTAPAGFGNDYAGEIDEVGAGVEGFAVGDRVFGGARGRAIAEHVVVTIGSDTLAHTPAGVSDEVAGSLTIAARTADAALRVAAVAEGDTVLVGGAAGGVGVIVVQLAVAKGATVIATASEGNHDFLRGLGAIPTTYGDGLAERLRSLAPSGVDAAIDLHGVEAVHAALESGVDPRRIATIAAGPHPPGGAVPTGGQDAAPDALDRIAQAIADGALALPIQATFPIERVSEAVELQRGGHVRGKIVVTVP
ncbi:NADP-dependent oxidoreductase [Microbacterium rhizomatis]|uniref:NADP-dependent oxidoreductase n=1 Tax=Microbacterium rhizomatis TaxID=1631477 RepID=A0A5J5J8V3_9MICO|nr:NADP-dependent oxidoreductase [Microbacterium rhizomatis]KAA9111445.1 NADP-dependent oxidoreductase [Microbacterium rhizomatis]